MTSNPVNQSPAANLPAHSQPNGNGAARRSGDVGHASSPTVVADAAHAVPLQAAHPHELRIRREQAVNGAWAGPRQVADRVGVTDPAAPPRVTVIIPAMNEAENLPWVFSRLPSGIDELILVDGHSVDDTVEVAKRLRPTIRVLQQQGRGKGAALRTGFTAATGDYIVMLDADGSMDPQEISGFVAALDAGYAFAKGSRFLPGGGSHDLTPLRRLGNDVLRRSVNALFLVPFTDLCYGYVAFRRDALGPLALGSHGFEIETELAIRAIKARLRIAEVPSLELCRRNGQSNLHPVRDGQRVLRTLVRERLIRSPRAVVDHMHPVSWSTMRPAVEDEAPLTIDLRDAPEAVTG